MLRSYHLSSVWMERLAGHVGGIFGGQKHVARPHLFGLPRSAHRGAFAKVLDVLLREGGEFSLCDLYITCSKNVSACSPATGLWGSAGRKRDYVGLSVPSPD